MRSLYGSWCCSSGGDTGEGLHLSVYHRVLVLQVWPQGLKSSELFCFPGTYNGKAPRLKGIQPHWSKAPALRCKTGFFSTVQAIQAPRSCLVRLWSSSLWSFTSSTVSKPILTTHSMWTLLVSWFIQTLKRRKKMKFMKWKKSEYWLDNYIIVNFYGCENGMYYDYIFFKVLVF